MIHLLGLAVSAVLSSAGAAHGANPGFVHGWTTVQDQMWGWFGGGYSETEKQLEFYANNYRIVVIVSGPKGPKCGPNGGPCVPPEPCHTNASYPGQLYAKQLAEGNQSINQATSTSLPSAFKQVRKILIASAAEQSAHSRGGGRNPKPS